MAPTTRFLGDENIYFFQVLSTVANVPLDILRKWHFPWTMYLIWRGQKPGFATALTPTQTFEQFCDSLVLQVGLSQREWDLNDVRILEYNAEICTCIQTLFIIATITHLIIVACLFQLLLFQFKKETWQWWLCSYSVEYPTFYWISALLSSMNSKSLSVNIILYGRSEYFVRLH